MPNHKLIINVYVEKNNFGNQVDPDGADIP